MANESIVGDLINFRGMVYAPLNENGVVFLFGKVVEDLNMYIEEIKPGFPDCIARRFTGKGWQQTRVEFEYKSSAFKQHKHDSKGCDVIVCWEHDWPDCPLEVIELKDRIKGLENRPIKKPEVNYQDIGQDESISLDEIQKELFNKLVEVVKSINDSSFYNAGKTLLSIYSPQRAFIYVKPMKKALGLWVYTDGQKLGDIKPFNYENAAQKWGKIKISSVAELDNIKPLLAESLKRVTKAIKNNEPTGWYAKIEEAEGE